MEFKTCLDKHKNPTISHYIKRLKLESETRMQVSSRNSNPHPLNIGIDYGEERCEFCAIKAN